MSAARADSMARARWLTPAVSPADSRCILLEIPNTPEYFAILRAFLYDLSNCENWEESPDGISPCDAAAWAETIWTSFEDKVDCP